MKKTTVAATAIIITLIIAASAYGSYNLLYVSTSFSPSPTPSPSPTLQPTTTPSPSPTPSPTPSSTPSSASELNLPFPQPTPTPTITITDMANNTITIELPVERIISINSGLTEILCALGCEDRIVGRDESSTLPPSVLQKPVCAENSYVPNVEVIIELQPDVLFADSMLSYVTEKYEQLKDAGIPVFIADPTDPEPTAHSNETVIDFSCKLFSKIAVIVGAEQKATEYISYVQYYNNLVKERIETLTPEERPKVMMEWYQPYYTFVTPGLDQAGGINIAENQTVYAPLLSAEFVVEQNPDIIIRAIMSHDHDEADFIDIRNEILSRPEISEVNAIKNEKVYVYDFVIRGGVRCVVGHLYWAKWCQPDLFADIDPAAINAEINQMFFGTEIPGVFAYP